MELTAIDRRLQLFSHSFAFEVSHTLSSKLPHEKKRRLRETIERHEVLTRCSQWRATFFSNFKFGIVFKLTVKDLIVANTAAIVWASP